MRLTQWADLSDRPEETEDIIISSEQCDYYSSSGSDTTESDDGESGDDGGFHILIPTWVGRQRVLTSRMKDYLQYSCSEVCLKVFN